jgi:hypothetical protein
MKKFWYQCLGHTNAIGTLPLRHAIGRLSERDAKSRKFDADSLGGAA